jgi:hypothetical protein
MRGRDFLAVARNLAPLKTEAHWRAAVGCAYYAEMLETRDELQRRGFGTFPRHQVHAEVRLRFTYPAHVDVKSVGDALNQLVQWRNHAHYQLGKAGPFVSNQVVVRAITIAQDAIDVLDRLDGDPAQRTAAITAIRAAGF